MDWLGDGNSFRTMGVDIIDLLCSFAGRRKRMSRLLYVWVYICMVAALLVDQCLPTWDERPQDDLSGK
jgi:hypothetical protein